MLSIGAIALQGSDTESGSERMATFAVKTGTQRTLKSLLHEEREEPGLDGGDEVAVGGHVAVGHAGGVEGEAGIAVAVEEDQAAGGVSAFGEKMDGFARGHIGGGNVAGRGRR